MKRFFAKNKLLILIILLASFLRFWNLGGVPPSTSMDEASIGYDAYSVIKTGGDEYKQFPLISQRGYDDWRRSTYLFLVAPSVGLFGLNSIAIRLPAVILSILTVISTYFIVLLLFSKRSTFSGATALLAALLIAISPWHIYISRLGHESNACLSFFVFGVLFFLLGEKKKKWTYVVASGLFFMLSMISYYSGQALVPLFAIGLIIIFGKSLFSLITSDKKAIVTFFLLVVLLIPVTWSVFNPQALVRFSGTSTFNPAAHQQMFDQMVALRNQAQAHHDYIGMIVNNYRVFPIRVFLEGYFSHFNIAWLFTNPSADSFKVPNIGLLYLWEAPFILIGIFLFLFSDLLDKRAKKMILLWFVLAPVPAAIATQAPHAMRSYNILPTWQIFEAFGLVYLYYKFPKTKVFSVLAFGILIVGSIAVFYKNYFIVFPKTQSKSFFYAASKTIPFVLSKQDNYKEVVFSNQDNLYQSYMLFLYHSHYDPTLYQRQGGTKSGGYAEVHSFGKYAFRPLAKEMLKSDTLYVMNSSEAKGKSITILSSFTNLDGKPAIIVAEKK